MCVLLYFVLLQKKQCIKLGVNNSMTLSPEKWGAIFNSSVMSNPTGSLVITTYIIEFISCIPV